MTHERYEELLDQLLEGELSEPELREFNSLLLGDQTLATDASDRLAEHRLLGSLHQPFDPDQIGTAVMNAASHADSDAAEVVANVLLASNQREPGPRQTTDRSWWLRFGLLAASILIGFGWLAWKTPQRTDPQRTDPHRNDPIANTTLSHPIVDTLLLAENCTWNSTPRVEGERLTIGLLALKAGLAVIRFDGGAELVLCSDCALELLSAGGVHVDQGDIIVRASDEAAGFRIQTPSSELIDLGTEFSANVGGNGETTLNVLEGEVSIRPRKNNANPPQLLGQGKSVMIKDATSEPEHATHDDLRFATVIRKANPRSRADLRYAYEGFFYDIGNVPLNESTKGHGWRGPWRKRTLSEGYRADQDTTDSLEIVHGEMNVTWGVRGGELGMLKMPPGTTVRLREMKRSINLNADGIYYFSMMVREPERSLRTHDVGPHERVRVTIRSKEDYRGEALSFGISQQLKPRIRTGQGVGFVSATQSPTGQTTLWIGKVVARQNGEDEVYFRIFGEDEELHYAEPSQWHVASRNLELSANLQLVVLSSEGTSPRYIDELKIGPTWRSVAPLRP